MVTYGAAKEVLHRLRADSSSTGKEESSDEGTHIELWFKKIELKRLKRYKPTGSSIETNMNEF